MALSFQRIAVVGATGPTGRTLAGELAAGGHRLRVVSRRLDRLNACFPISEIEKRSGDALDYASIDSALEGCDLVVDCIGLPSQRMVDHPAVARNLSRWVRKAEARCLQVSSYWSYMPIRQLPVSERHPRRGGSPWVRLRREAEDILRECGGAIVHLPDFFGPHVHTSTLQNALDEAIAGKPMNWIGSANTERDYCYVPDAMHLVARLLTHEQAYGEDWIIPGSGPLSAKRLADILNDRLQNKVKVRAAPPWLLRVVSLFRKDLRDFMQLVPEYIKPIAFDGNKLDRLLGETPRTPYPQALETTIASRQAS